MITVFMFYENLEYLINLSNKFAALHLNIRLLGLDQYLSPISIRFCQSHKPNIIICGTSYNSTLEKLLNYKYYSLNIPNESQTTTTLILNQLNKLSLDTRYSHKLNMFNFKKAIYNELILLKFNPNLCGTKYLVDCIVLARENPYSQLNNLDFKKYFNKLALKYNTNTQTIIWNIRTAIDDMYKATNSSFRKDKFGNASYITYQSIINSLRLL